MLLLPAMPWPGGSDPALKCQPRRHRIGKAGRQRMAEIGEGLNITVPPEIRGIALDVDPAVERQREILTASAFAAGSATV
jgi:hypothetical protein